MKQTLQVLRSGEARGVEIRDDKMTISLELADGSVHYNILRMVTEAIRRRLLSYFVKAKFCIWIISRSLPVTAGAISGR